MRHFLHCLVAAALFLAVTAGPAAASWNGCGQYTMVSGTPHDLKMVIGQAALGAYPSMTPSGYVAYCVLDSAGKQHYHEASYCSTSLVPPSPDFGWKFIAIGNEFDNTIGVAMLSDVQCNDDITGLHWILKWNPAFIFGLYAEGHAGGDTIYGTPNEDIIYSNDFWSTADSSKDTLCGYATADILYGDLDDSGGANESLDGGTEAPGTSDQCHVFGAGNDATFACELVLDGVAHQLNPGVCGNNPPNFWP